MSKLKIQGRPVLGISIGDPAGIGPEICIKALSRKEIYEKAVPVVYADRIVLEDGLLVTGKNFTLNQIKDPAGALGKSGVIDFIESGVLTKKGSMPTATLVPLPVKLPFNM